MIKRIDFGYSQKSPLGIREDRFDEVHLSEYENENGTAKEYVRRLLAYMFKLVNDFHEFDFCRFVDEFDNMLLCEVKNADVWAKRKVVTVTHIDKNNGKDVPYVIDVASLRKKLYAMCDVKEA